MWKAPSAGPRGLTAIRGVLQARWQTMSKLIHVASATATNAASVLLPMLVTMLMNDGSLVTGSATGNAAAIALRGPLAAADTVALLLASSLILLSAACDCSCNVVSCCPFFFSSGDEPAR